MFSVRWPPGWRSTTRSDQCREAIAAHETTTRSDRISAGLVLNRESRATSGDSRHRGTRPLMKPQAVIVDTRAQNLFDFSGFPGWFSGVEYRLMRLGHYSIAGLEDVCVVERKDLPDLCARLRSSDSCS